MGAKTNRKSVGFASDSYEGLELDRGVGNYPDTIGGLMVRHADTVVFLGLADPNLSLSKEHTEAINQSQRILVEHGVAFCMHAGKTLIRAAMNPPRPDPITEV